MKNFELLTVARLWFGKPQPILYNTIDGSEAYKVAKFNRELRKAYDEINATNNDMLHTLVKPEFISESGQILEDKMEPEERKHLDESMNAYMNAVATLEVKTLRYENWHNLQKENGDRLYGEMETFLYKVLWDDSEMEEQTQALTDNPKGKTVPFPTAPNNTGAPRKSKK